MTAEQYEEGDRLLREAGSIAEIDSALARLEPANVAFNAPSELREGETADIQLLVSLTKPIKELQADLSEVGEREGERVRVSPLMEAKLGEAILGVFDDPPDGLAELRGALVSEHESRVGHGLV